ncbi:MAG: DUF362 domain-containing protein [Actinobacteria bacterium]|nr:DUF362 domain-containing protein [Actinomycetota bacterium]MBU2686097.1 DUF362 domain-containing protein [Actinomycetota bacterium]
MEEHQIHHRCDGGDGHVTEEEPKGLWARARKYVYGNALLVGILSLLWLVIRTGRKPSRINYPCQKAALTNVSVFLGAAALPIAARLPRYLAPGRAWPRLNRFVKVGEVVLAAGLAVLLVVGLAGRMGGNGGRSHDEMKAAAAGLKAVEMRSGEAGASSIYVAENIPNQSEYGVNTLINVMDANGQDFFKSDRPGGGGAAGPGGIIGRDDIVMIKVNGEWRWRGGTNSDVVKGLVEAITNHPDGFTGEVVIVENGQWDSYMDNRADNQNPNGCNAEDITQSYNDVALMYAAKGHKVSVYDWTAVQTLSVGEFGGGDMRDGYCYVPEIEEGYPKFTTVYGTRISARYGWWNGSSYDNGRVRFLNVPVLKDHSGAGVTCCVKHYMGFQDLWQGTQNAPHTPMINNGLFGSVMHVCRYPDLNIVDAVWVTPAGGPNGPYASAVRANKLLASQDPIALDYYAAKHVLLPVSGNSKHNPDVAGNTFRTMLFSTRDVLLAAGRQVTTDEAMMNVYTGAPPDVPPATAFDYYLAEGCTAYGYETWVLVANPNDEAATVSISYFTDSGCRNADPITVPPRSRLTVNAASCIWEQNAGVRVGSDRPVYVERAMYWSDRAEGHDSTGTDAGAAEWYVSEGHTADGFDDWLEILNPGSEPASAAVSYYTPGGTVAGPTVSVAPYARSTVHVNEVVPSGDVSAKVTSDRPVVVEGSLYWDSRRGGNGSIGVTAPATDWYLAEGCTGWGFDTYVQLLNPGTKDARVECEFMTGEEGADPIGRTITVPAGTRRTVWVNDVVQNKDVSTVVHSDEPIVAGRSMLWPVPGGKAGHVTNGMTAPATEVFLPEGCTAYGFDTWLLLQNPGDADVTATVTGMTEGGEESIGTFAVKSKQRVTVHVNEYYQGNLSLKVNATGPIACERGVYWNNRGGGTCSTGY